MRFEGSKREGAAGNRQGGKDRSTCSVRVNPFESALLACCRRSCRHEKTSWFLYRRALHAPQTGRGCLLPRPATKREPKASWSRRLSARSAARVSRNDPARLKRLIGRRVAEARRARGWTQEHLAEQLGVSTRYEQSVEAGRENLTIETLCKLGDALEVSVFVEVGDGTSGGPGAVKTPRRRKPAE